MRSIQNWAKSHLSSEAKVIRYGKATKPTGTNGPAT